MLLQHYFKDQLGTIGSHSNLCTLCSAAHVCWPSPYLDFMDHYRGMDCWVIIARKRYLQRFVSLVSKKGIDIEPAIQRHCTVLPFIICLCLWIVQGETRWWTATGSSECGAGRATSTDTEWRAVCYGKGHHGMLRVCQLSMLWSAHQCLNTDSSLLMPSKERK